MGAESRGRQARKQSRKALLDKTEFYEIIQDPANVPLRFSTDGYYRIAAKVACTKCGHPFVQVLRCHRFRTEIGIDLPAAKAPDPSDEKVITTLLIKACEHGVGEPKLHAKGCQFASLPKSKFILAGVQSRLSVRS